MQTDDTIPDPVVRNSFGKWQAEGLELPDLPEILPWLEADPRFRVIQSRHSPAIPGKLSGDWSLVFEWNGHPMRCETNYHAGFTTYAATETTCPESVFREMLECFEGLIPSPPKLPTVPELDPIRLFRLFCIACGIVALGLVIVFLRSI